MIDEHRKIFFSIVVPTYSRPDEVIELLGSLENQDYKHFEVILADGSPDDLVRQVLDHRTWNLDIKYLYQKKLGISESRNWGVANAKGEFIVFFDSDCIIPPEYFSVVSRFLNVSPTDAWGGPDRAHQDFNARQKAISYAMTSLFTTGGIRGRKSHAGQYQPRSFNLGINKDVFHALGGFSGLKVSEDIDLSMRLYSHDKKVSLIEEAYVYHKRRSTWYKFFRQVNSFGSGRIDLQMRHRNALKLVHMLPSFFVFYLAIGWVTVFVSTGLFLAWLCSLLIYSLVILLDSTIQNRSLAIGFLSIYASLVMLSGYGTGMIKAILLRGIFKSTRESEKPEITKSS